MPTPNSEKVITLDLSLFIMPFAIVLAAIIMSLGIYAGLANIGGNLKNVSVAGAATTTTTTTTDATGAVTVSIDSINALFADSGSIVVGNRDAKLKLVEFSDPSCPYCHIASGKNGELNKQAGEKFTLVADGGTYVAPVEEFKRLVEEGKAAYTFQYTNGHGNGELATQALYCANEQGKFWPVHDLLYSAAGYTIINDVVKNDAANSGKLADFVSSAIDKSFLEGCLTSGKYAARIAQDQSTGATLGVSGTPGFFVNETNFAGAYSFTDMQATVDAVLNQ